MAKILFREKSDKEPQKFYYVVDPSKDYSTAEGLVTKKDLKKEDGSVIKTNKGQEYIIFSSGFKDDYKKMKRKAQIITLKDIGVILTESGVNKTSKVLDAGTGSGALATYLAHICKEVISYDIREDAIEVGEKNKEFFKLKNLTFKNKDITKGISEKDLDLVVLDIPNPGDALESCDKSLKIGGYLISYVPTVLQVVDFVNTIEKHRSFVFLKTSETIERGWKIHGRVARPNFDALGHTGFLTICRKIR